MYDREKLHFKKEAVASLNNAFEVEKNNKPGTTQIGALSTAHKLQSDFKVSSIFSIVPEKPDSSTDRFFTIHSLAKYQAMKRDHLKTIKIFRKKTQKVEKKKAL